MSLWVRYLPEKLNEGASLGHCGAITMPLSEMNHDNSSSVGAALLSEFMTNSDNNFDVTVDNGETRKMNASDRWRVTASTISNVFSCAVLREAQIVIEVIEIGATIRVGSKEGLEASVTALIGGVAGDKLDCIAPQKPNNPINTIVLDNVSGTGAGNRQLYFGMKIFIFAAITNPITGAPIAKSGYWVR